MVSTLPPNGDYDVYVKDVSLGTVWGLTKTLNSNSAQPGTAHDGSLSDQLTINDSGTVVAFSSTSGNLISNDDAGALILISDIFRADLNQNGTFQLSLATRAPSGFSNVTHVTDDPFLTGPVISGNGSYIAFSTVSYSSLGISGSSNSAHGVGTGTFPAAPNGGGLPFFIWAFSLPFGHQGVNDNPSGDGVPNLVKFFIGSEPTVPDRRFLPVLGKAKGQTLGLPSDNRDYLTLSVRIRQQLRKDYNWSVQTSPTLAGLVSSPVAAVQVGLPVTDQGFNTYLFRYPTPVSGAAKGFMRLKTSIPSDPGS